MMIDLLSFGYGALVATAVIGFGGWAWFHYWPDDRTKDARDLARKRLSEK